MSRKFEYAVIQLADPERDERLNAALAIFSDDGLDLRIPKRLDKLRALSAAIDLDSVRSAIGQLAEFDGLARGQGRRGVSCRIDALAALSPLKFSASSYFVAPTTSSYEDWVVRLLRALVEPEPARLKVTKKRSKLLSVVKSAFKAERVLAKRGEDISDHRLVSNFRIAEGLAADFVLKNGAMHVIETVDASNDELSIRKVVSDIAVSALVLEQARMTFGEKETESQLIYDASAAAEKIAMPSLEAAAHQGTKLVNWASQDDRNKLLVHLASLATPYDVKSLKNNHVGFHASTQHKFNLN